MARTPPGTLDHKQPILLPQDPDCVFKGAQHNRRSFPKGRRVQIDQYEEGDIKVKRVELAQREIALQKIDVIIIIINRDNRHRFLNNCICCSLKLRN